MIVSDGGVMNIMMCKGLGGSSPCRRRFSMDWNRYFICNMFSLTILGKMFRLSLGRIVKRS